MVKIAALPPRRRAVELVVVPERVSETTQFYSVLVPANILQSGLRFEARDALGRATTIWTAGTIAIELPLGWRFSRYNVALEYGPPLLPLEDNDCRFFLREFSLHDASIRLQLVAFASGADVLKSGGLRLFRFRSEDEQQEFPLKISNTESAFGVSAEIHPKYTDRRVFFAETEIPLPDAFGRSALYSVLISAGEMMRSIFLYEGSKEDVSTVFEWRQEDGESFIFHYFPDPASKNVRLETFKFSAADFERAKEILAPTPWDGADPVWLVGEYPNTARDNGWALFEYLRESSEIDARYVITDPNMDGVATDNKKILQYGSVEHLAACRRAQALLFSHHAVYIYPDLLKTINESIGHKPVMHFVQHGVLAIKPMLASYEKKKHNYDIFNVSSQREQALVVRRCKWKAEDVAICGLPRWDNLARRNEAFSQEGRRPSRVLIFPTWRPSLDKLSDEKFRQSEFYENWTAATRKIVDIARRRGIEVDFCSHSIFERFGSAFDDIGANNVRITDAIERLPDYVALITDYSSLCFDFLYLNKPSLFFMFDRDAFFAREMPYINVETELPGLAALSLSDLDETVPRILDGSLPDGLVASDFVKTEAGNSQRIIDETAKKLFATLASRVRRAFEARDYDVVLQSAGSVKNFTAPFAVLDKNLFDIRMAEAKALLRTGAVEDCLGTLRDIERIYGTSSHLALIKAKALSLAGETNAALETAQSGYFGLSVDTQESDARELQLLQAQLLLSSGKPAQARQLLTEILSSQPNSETVRLFTRAVLQREDLPAFEQAVLPRLSAFGNDAHHVQFQYAYLLRRLGVADRATLVARERFLTIAARRRLGAVVRLDQSWVDQLQASLSDLAADLRKGDVLFFLSGVTLLACVDGSVPVGHPRTIEVGVQEGVSMTSVKAALEASSRWLIRRQHDERYLEAQHASGVAVEIFSYFSHKAKLRHESPEAIWRNAALDLTSVEFMGGSYLAPSDPEQYLTESFGDWRAVTQKAPTLIHYVNRRAQNPQADVFAQYIALGDSYLTGDLVAFRNIWHTLRDAVPVDPLVAARANDILENASRYRAAVSTSAVHSPASAAPLAGLSPLTEAERATVPSAARRALRDIVRIPMNEDDLLLEARMFNDLLATDPNNVAVQTKFTRAALLAGRAKMAALKYEDACKIFLSLRQLASSKVLADKNLIMAALRGARRAEASRDRKAALTFWNYLKLADPKSNVAAQGILRCSR